MKLYAPKYYNSFKCIAGACEHSCCIGWEIDIDEKALEKYKSLKYGYGATIANTIDTEETPHFILDCGERCPHLDENGLCKIIINLGEEYLCDICREHPRFYNFSSNAYLGIGMSCPEAARVILSFPDYSTFEKIGETNAVCDGIEFDGFDECKKIYIILGDNAQDYIDRLEKIYHSYKVNADDDKNWLQRLDTLEYLNEEHKKLFLKYSYKLRPKEKESKEYLQRFLAYLIYRHTIEAIDMDDFCVRLSFCLFCERLLSSLICTENAKMLGDVSKLASIISEEIEYSSDNTFSLMC